MQGRGITARRVDPTHRRVSSGPLVPAETTSIVCMNMISIENIDENKRIVG